MEKGKEGTATTVKYAVKKQEFIAQLAFRLRAAGNYAPTAVAQILSGIGLRHDRWKDDKATGWTPYMVSDLYRNHQGIEAQTYETEPTDPEIQAFLARAGQWVQDNKVKSADRPLGSVKRGVSDRVTQRARNLGQQGCVVISYEALRHEVCRLNLVEKRYASDIASLFAKRRWIHNRWRKDEVEWKKSAITTLLYSREAAPIRDMIRAALKQGETVPVHSDVQSAVAAAAAAAEKDETRRDQTEPAAPSAAALALRAADEDIRICTQDDIRHEVCRLVTIGYSHRAAAEYLTKNKLIHNRWGKVDQKRWKGQAAAWTPNAVSNYSAGDAARTIRAEMERKIAQGETVPAIATLEEIGGTSAPEPPPQTGLPWDDDDDFDFEGFGGEDAAQTEQTASTPASSESVPDVVFSINGVVPNRIDATKAGKARFSCMCEMEARDGKVYVNLRPDSMLRNLLQ